MQNFGFERPDKRIILAGFQIREMEITLDGTGGPDSDLALRGGLIRLKFFDQGQPDPGADQFGFGEIVIGFDAALSNYAARTGRR